MRLNIENCARNGDEGVKAWALDELVCNLKEMRDRSNAGDMHAAVTEFFEVFRFSDNQTDPSPVRAAVQAAQPEAVPVEYLIRARWPDGIEQYLDVRGVYQLSSSKVGIDVNAPDGHPLASAPTEPMSAPTAAPVAWTNGIQWHPKSRYQSEQVVKLTRTTQPEHGYTIPLYATPTSAAAQPEVVGLIRAMLHNAMDRMDRARNLLTDGKPRPDCNWGMLDASDLRKALASAPTEPMSAPTAAPVATLWVQMETHDMGQSLAPNPPFKVAIAKAHTAAKDLPLGEYLLFATPLTESKPAQQDAVDAWTEEDMDSLCWSAFESAMAGGVSVDSFRWLANSLRAKQLPQRAAISAKKGQP